jgi:hypothetical protein
MLGPGGASGVVFMQFPKSGPVLADTQAEAEASEANRVAGQAAWDRIVRSMPAAFPGKVMYLPVGSSVLLDGRFSTWLPTPTAPNAPRSQWVRVRKIDNVHLCPAGVTRYADALLADFTALYHLPAAHPTWSMQPWTKTATRYDTPPDSCPDDHPTTG